MSEETTRWKLPYILANQAQKHITHNEAIRLLDALIGTSAISRSINSPPGSPSDGDLYIVANGGTGAWDGWDFNVAYYVDGAWMKIVPLAGMRAWVEDEAALAVYDGSEWIAYALGAEAVVSRGASESENRFGVKEELISGLSGASAESVFQIPNGSIVFGVSSRVTSAITGATDFDCGIAGESGKFGSGLGVSLGSTNFGVIGPTAFYVDTPILLTANGGSFSGGAVRIAVHYFKLQVPQS